MCLKVCLNLDLADATEKGSVLLFSPREASPNINCGGADNLEKKNFFFEKRELFLKTVFY